MIDSIDDCEELFGTDDLRLLELDDKIVELSLDERINQPMRSHGSKANVYCQWLIVNGNLNFMETKLSDENCNRREADRIS